MSSGPGASSPPTHRRWLQLLTVTTALLLGLLIWVDRELRIKGAAWGILSLQLAGSEAAAKHIVANVWNRSHLTEAAFELGFDYLFIASYSAWLFMGCQWAASRWHQQNESRGALIKMLAWLAVAAAICDVIENVILFDFIHAIHSKDKLPAYFLAFWSTILKFAFATTALAAFLSGLLAGGDGNADKKPAPDKKAEPAKK